MDHSPGRQLTSGGDNGLAWGERATKFYNLSARRLDFGAPSFVDGPIHTAASYQARVSGVDDGVYLLGRDVTF